MVKIVAKEIPLAELILRKYERPVTDSRRELVKKLCLSVGLLQPGDSRDVVVDILDVLLDANEPLNTEIIKQRVVDNRKKAKAPLQGIASSNIRRQLKRLKDMFIVEKTTKGYRIVENEPLNVIFEERIRKFYLPSIVSRVKEYFDAVEKLRKR